GERDLVSGLVVGLMSGLFFAFFIVIIDTWDLTDIFRNLGPKLVELLTFGRGIGVASILWIVGSGLLGLVGGVLRIVPRRVRGAVGAAFIGVLTVSLLEIIVTDITQGLRVEFVADWIYAINGGLTTLSAAVIAVLAGVGGWRSDERTLTERRQARMNLDPAVRFRRNVIAAVLTVAAVIFLPMILGGLTNELLTNVGLFVLMGLGLNIVVGSAGLLDLGYVAFFAVGAYTTAILTSPLSPYWTPELTLNFLSWEGWLIMAIVLLMAAIAGVFVGTPVIRLRGDYLAIVTLGFGEIVRILFLSDWLSPIFGGAQGITNIPSAALGPVALKGTNSQTMFYLVAAFIGVAIYVAWRLQHSRTGRAWTALREDEDVAEAMGVNTTEVKLLAFVIGATFAAIAGMLFAVKVGAIFPSSFKLLVSIIILVVVIVGGMGSIPGVIVGSVVLIGILGGPTQPGLLQEFAEFKLLVYGALLVAMMLKRPEGLWPSLRRQRELHQDEVGQDAWLKIGESADENGDS
ncbi:MAG: branched-chain amino acid ABC transporter permease, partial [Proteobacteria bacterium]|nr:branched-chain amino acid ABC transporter permease [Pseudomonadota bacterium]